VAVTRAKYLMIVIGNPETLQKDRNWYQFVKYCYNNGACAGLPFKMKDFVETPAELDNLNERISKLQINPFESSASFNESNFRRQNDYLYTADRPRINESVNNTGSRFGNTNDNSWFSIEDMFGLVLAAGIAIRHFFF
jgi:hypothetical protein